MVLKRAFESIIFQPNIYCTLSTRQSFIWKIILSGYQSEGRSAFFYSRQLFRNERYTDSKEEREKVRENKYNKIEKLKNTCLQK